MEYTLTYSEPVSGWVSFYSFIPDFMIGMNNHFYSFKSGNLYKHSVNATRNNFYGQQYNSMLKSVFNNAPLENKLFKTINLEGDAAWSALMETDIQNTGFVELAWFEKKENSFYAFVRNSGDVPALANQYPLRSLNGIGRSTTVSGPNTAQVIDFSISPLVSIGSIVSVGDYLYFATPPYNNPILAGQITAINVDYPSSINNIVVDATISGATYPVPIQDAYFLFIKNSVAESHGVLGHYCVFTLENDSTSKVELFSAESEVMKSYP